MRSLHTSQNTQPNLNLINMMNNNRGVSSLASQFMDMFDASKLNTSLLKKRELQTQDSLHQRQLQKKIKISTDNTDLTRPSPLQLTGINPMLYGLNCQFNPLLAALGGDQSFGLQSASQLQNLALLKQQKEALLGLQPLSFPNLSNSQSLLQMKVQQSLKQEYIKQEEAPTSQSSPNSNPFKSTLSDKHTMNEDSPVHQTSTLEMTEPALVDFTREFPDWDLATIFSYIKSGKSREVFEKEKQYKIERKIRRKKLRMANKEKALAAQQGKAVRGKRMTGKAQETY